MTGQRAHILAVTSELPWPLNSGGHLRTYHLLRALVRAFERVTLVVPVWKGSREHVDVLRDAGVDVRPVDVGGRRATGEVRRALTALVSDEPYVFYHRHNWRRVASELRTLAHQLAPDVLYLDHLDSYQYASAAPGLPRVLDLHNVYSVLVERSAAEKSAVQAALLGREAARVRRTEQKAVTDVDLTLAVSDADAEVFRGWSARQVVVVPNGVDAAAYATVPVGRRASELPRLLFLGALSWPPNVSAARILATEILSRVRQRHPAAEAHLVGRAPTPDVQALDRIPGVKVFGDVPDVGLHLAESTMLVVPLEAGGGTRLKILEAFAAGLPVVSTPVGCEGLDVVDGTHLLVAERDGLGDAVIRALEHPDLCDALARNGRALVEKQYDWQSVGRLATDAVAALLGRQQPAIRT